MFAALAVGLSLVAAACGERRRRHGTARHHRRDDDDRCRTTTHRHRRRDDRHRRRPTRTGRDDRRHRRRHDGRSPPATSAMTITIDINPDAVWEDGTPITCGRLRVHVAGEPEHAWLDQAPPATTRSSGRRPARATSRSSSASARSTRRTRACSTRSSRRPPSTTAWTSRPTSRPSMPISARPYMLDSWSENEIELRARTRTGGANQHVTEHVTRHRLRRPATPRSPRSRPARSTSSTRSSSRASRTRSPTRTSVPAIGFGGDYEALYFQMGEDEYRPVRRRRRTARRSRSRSTVTRCSQQIYVPLVDGRELLQCGPIVPGPYCPEALRPTTPTTRQRAEQIMTDAGWAKNGDGFWADATATCPRSAGWSTPATPAVRAPRRT